MKRIKRLSFWTLWAVCLMSGVVAGTVWANLLGRELLGQIGYFDGLYQRGGEISRGEQRRLWRYVIGQRVWEAGLCGLVATTPFAEGAYLAITFGAGFVLAVMITVFTLEKSWFGIVYWLISVSPHGAAYLAAAMALTMGVKERKERLPIRIWIGAGILVLTGCFLEAWIAPGIQQICYRVLER